MDIETNPYYTIAICTHNRAHFLSISLNALLACSYVKKHEVLVILNNCTDSSQEICENYQQINSNFRYCIESETGLSIARNRALKESRAPWIAFLDDDGIPGKNFCTEIERAIETEFDIIGGFYFPYFVTSRPFWFKRKWASNWSPLKINAIQPMPPGKFASGGIILIRKSIIAHVGNFSTHLGMKGSQIAFGEETNFQIIAQSKGFQLGLNPQWKMLHYTAPHKMTLKFLIQSSASYVPLVIHDEKTIITILRIIKSSVTIPIFFFTSKPKTLLPDIAKRIGWILGLCKKLLITN